MAGGHSLEEGGTVCTVFLREGLRFHDGEPVLARDCVASLQRWMRRSPVGQTLRERLDALEAPDDRRLVFRLKRPFPHLITALGSVASPVPFIMAERHARTDPFRQVTEVVAHIRAALTQTQLSIPVADGRPVLGTWQGIYLWEHRTSPHRRGLVLHLLGEPSPN